jgi:hypothetical protein
MSGYAGFQIRKPVMARTSMPNDVTLGVPGLELAPGGHVCALYPTLADRDDILMPYLREGLSRGDKCFCAVDSTDSESVLVALGADVDLAPFLDRHQLDVREARETYLRDGRFSPDTVIKFWEHEVGEALSGEFSFARVVGEMTWALRLLSNIEELVVYESRLNRYLPRYPQAILCMYELGRFDGDTLVDVLKVHPKVLLGGMLIDNPYYIEPDEFLATRQRPHEPVSHSPI